MSNRHADAAAALACGLFEITESEREFLFTDADFQYLGKLAYDQAGIVLADSKRNLVYSRLSRRLRSLGLTSFRQYRARLAADSSEIEGFINAISTNLTKFFREPHHFEHFRTHVAIPYARAVARKPAGRLRVWSAGCSTGEEPYSIAAVLNREIRDANHRDVRILATDIDTEVIARGVRGEYPLNSIDEVPKAYRECFQSGRGESDPESIIMGEDLRSLIAFRRLNLMEAWPFSGKFDAIFCRNVMIYFDANTRSMLVGRFVQQLHPGGWLYIGHSESLLGSHDGLELGGRTTYRKVK
jgi:chemotaxis protein methyltransferase CheR